MPRHLLVAATSLIALAACESAATKPQNPGPAASAQQWICGREYVNFAWGYQRRGAVIDAQGHVWTYGAKIMPGGKSWQPKDAANLTEAEVAERYAGAVDTGQRASPDDVARNTALIAEAAAAKPTEGKNVGADMGAHVAYCYSYAPATHTYRTVLLDQKGDWESTNPSPAAKKLTAWIDRVIGEVK